jgi:hypothetical protein
MCAFVSSYFKSVFLCYPQCLQQQTNNKNAYKSPSLSQLCKKMKFFSIPTCNLRFENITLLSKTIDFSYLFCGIVLYIVKMRGVLLLNRKKDRWRRSTVFLRAELSPRRDNMYMARASSRPQARKTHTDKPY